MLLGYSKIEFCILCLFYDLRGTQLLLSHHYKRSISGDLNSGLLCILRSPLTDWQLQTKFITGADDDRGKYKLIEISLVVNEEY